VTLKKENIIRKQIVKLLFDRLYYTVFYGIEDWKLVSEPNQKKLFYLIQVHITKHAGVYHSVFSAVNYSVIIFCKVNLLCQI
jgi:hypothetical protein